MSAIRFEFLNIYISLQTIEKEYSRLMLSWITIFAANVIPLKAFTCIIDIFRWALFQKFVFSLQACNSRKFKQYISGEIHVILYLLRIIKKKRKKQQLSSSNITASLMKDVSFRKQILRVQRKLELGSRAEIEQE